MGQLKKAHLEHLSGVVRVFEDGRDFGDPYCFAATVRWKDPTTVEILGITKPPVPSDWRAMRELFAEMSVSRVEIKRRREGGEEELRVIEVPRS